MSIDMTTVSLTVLKSGLHGRVGRKKNIGSVLIYGGGNASL